MRSPLVGLLTLSIVSGAPLSAGALPPPGAISAVGLQRDTWVEHQVIPGDRVVEIASYYGVSADQVCEWNHIDPKQPLLRVGKRLRILTQIPALERHLRRYKVQLGDTWARIADRFSVDKVKLRRIWNAEHDELKAGDRVDVWVESHDAPRAPEPIAREPQLLATAESVVLPTRVETRSDAALPIVAVPPTAESSGTPARGRLLHGIKLPENPALYAIRNPDNSYGSSHTIEQLQLGIASFRSHSSFSRELVIEDMSQRSGGRFKPHRSHRSGRDVDVELPLKPGIEAGTVPTLASQVDWDATWALVKSLIGTSQVRYIFLSRSRQQFLYEAAKRAGSTDEELQEYLQYPHSSGATYVRHSHGHVKHMHVRFACGPAETRCRD